MTPTLLDLARRLVALPSWEWRPGMLSCSVDLPRSWYRIPDQPDPRPEPWDAFLRQLVKLAKKYGSDDPRVLSRLRALLTIEGHVGVPESDGGATP